MYSVQGGRNGCCVIGRLLRLRCGGPRAATELVRRRLVQPESIGKVVAVRSLIYSCLTAFLIAARPAMAEPTNTTAAIAAVFQADRELDGIPLSTVIEATTGDFPRTADGRIQRSGYPDLRLVDRKSGTVIYVDPKLFERGSRASTFRTFYYEPKIETSKINDNAHHLIVGIEHGGAAGHWKFLNWDLVDVSGLRVKLKAEFQSSNKELYRPELIVGTSRKPAPVR